MINLFIKVALLTSLSFGGGQLLMAGLEHEFVQTGLLSKNDFALAIALGQSTPGPLASFTSAVGNALAGPKGAIVATSAMVFVSLAVALLITLIPPKWFKHPRSKSTFLLIHPIAVGMTLFLGIKTLHGIEEQNPVGITLFLSVFVGRLLKVPTLSLMFASIFIGIVQ